MKVIYKVTGNWCYKGGAVKKIGKKETTAVRVLLTISELLGVNG